MSVLLDKLGFLLKTISRRSLRPIARGTNGNHRNIWLYSQSCHLLTLAKSFEGFASVIIGDSPTQATINDFTMVDLVNIAYDSSKRPYAGL
jgi:hypothetical protein